MQHGEVVQPGGILQYVIPIVVVGVIFAFRAKSLTRARPLKLWQLWIVPVLLTVAAVFAFTNQPPPDRTGWLIAGAALLVGAAIGWQRGRLMHIEVEQETGTLMQRASPVALLFLLGLVVVKIAAKAEGQMLHVGAVTLSDALLALALGTFGVMRVEMHLRARRLLGEHRREVFS